MKISLVLPIYNVEKFLPRCIESCLKQDVSSNDYEIILVVDGSPDKSIDIAKEYSAKNNNVITVERENGGLSAARNSGLKVARGEYVWFIDSDDYIKENVLGNILHKLETNDLDCLWIKWVCVDDNDKLLPEYAPYRKGEDETVMPGNKFAATNLSTYLHAWSFIYKKSFLDERHLLFKEGMFFEDCEFAFRAIPQINRIMFHNEICYYYVQREGSIVHSLDERKLEDIRENILLAYNQSISFAENTPLALFYKKCYSVLVVMEIKEIARAKNKRLSYQNLRVFLKKNGITNVSVMGNTFAKVLSYVYNVFGLKASYLVALLAEKVRR